jgi:hypothetical protein
MCNVVECIQSDGPEYGYKLSKRKGTYLLAKCVDHLEAKRRKTVLMNRFHLDASMIHIHPDNLINVESSRVTYGVKILGGYIGMDEYIRSQHLKKIEELKIIGERIANFSNPQIAFLLLKRSFNFKINHLLRTSYPSDVVFLTGAFEEIKKLSMECIVESLLTEELMRLLRLPLSNGGVGLQDTSVIKEAAYVASIVACSDAFDPITTIELKSMTTGGECSKFVSNFVDSLKKLQEGADGSYPKEISDECIFSPSNVKDRRLQSVISQVAIQRHVAITRQEYINSESHTTSDMAWLEGISSEEGSLWMDTIPYKTEMEMKPQIFKSAIRYRYRLAQSTIIAQKMDMLL